MFSTWICTSAEILLMEDILHHLGCIRPCKKREIFHINWWSPDFWTINRIWTRRSIGQDQLGSWTLLAGESDGRFVFFPMKMSHRVVFFWREKHGDLSGLCIIFLQGIVSSYVHNDISYNIYIYLFILDVFCHLILLLGFDKDPFPGWQSAKFEW